MSRTPGNVRYVMLTYQLTAFNIVQGRFDHCGLSGSRFLSASNLNTHNLLLQGKPLIHHLAESTSLPPNKEQDRQLNMICRMTKARKVF